MQIVFRPIQTNEVDELKSIATTTFVQSYEHLNDPENFGRYITKAFTQEKLLEEIKNDESYYYFVLLNENIIGYLKLNVGMSQTEDYGDEYLEIERIYLDRGYQRRGIGSRMMSYALARGRALHKKKVWLGVWDRNPKAIRFYEGVGFSITGEHIFQFGDEDQRDLIMEMDIPD